LFPATREFGNSLSGAENVTVRVPTIDDIIALLALITLQKITGMRVARLEYPENIYRTNRNSKCD
jgi:hypothetical protein